MQLMKRLILFHMFLCLLPLQICVQFVQSSYTNLFMQLTIRLSGIEGPLYIYLDVPASSYLHYKGERVIFVMFFTLIECK